MPRQSIKRVAISRALRFDVFKRDCFKCQYCGATAPQVLLHVDHIVAVAKGGTNELANLLTSCIDCNLGKRDKSLDDGTTVMKARGQLEELQERREQLEMMMEWKVGLRDIASQALEQACEYWQHYTPEWSVTPTGRMKVDQWIRKFSLDEVLAAMDVAASQYLRHNQDGGITQESWDLAFSKIPGVCRIERESKENPDIKDLYYIRGIARNNCPNYFKEPEALELLKAARSWGISVQELRSVARQSYSWTRFSTTICELNDEARKEYESGHGQ